MPKHQYKGPVSKFSPPKIDEEKFHTLFDILHDGCFESNWSATARALQISEKTARRWAIKAPKRYWEYSNLHQAVKEVHRYMAGSKHKKIRTRAAKVLGQLNRNGLERIAEYMEWNTSSESEAILHLISTIAWQPHREISTEELFKAANAGGFSRRTLQRVADEVGLEKETKGYGENKVTWYSIPEP